MLICLYLFILWLSNNFIFLLFLVPIGIFFKVWEQTDIFIIKDEWGTCLKNLICYILVSKMYRRQTFAVEEHIDSEIQILQFNHSIQNNYIHIIIKFNY